MIKKTWKEHGTKLLGALSTVAGIVAAVDPVLILNALGSRWTAWVLMAVGLLTVRRGQQNTARERAPD